MELKKAKIHPESVNIKRKKITGHSWKSQFKKSRNEKNATDLKGVDKINHACKNNSKKVAPEPMVKLPHVRDECIKRKTRTLRDESNDESSDGHLEKVTSSLRYYGDDLTLKDNLVNEPSVEGSLENLTSSNAREISDDCERLPTSFSDLKNKDAPEPENAAFLGRLQDGTLTSECDENDKHPKGTLFANGENFGLLGICTLCSKEKSSSQNSKETKVCSCNATADMELCGSPACKKYASEDKVAGSETDDIIKQIQRKCDKRMKKLILKQQKESQEFHCVWDEKKLGLERSHKLEAAMIRYIYSQSSARVEKLKVLDDDYGKKIEENNLLMEAQLNDLEMRQQAAQNMERQKAANWLAEAKSCHYIGQTVVCGTWSLGSKSNEDGGCKNLLASEGRVCDETRSVEPNRIVPTELPEDQVHISSVSDDPEDTGGSVPEGGCLQIRIGNLNPVDTVTPVQSHVEAQTVKNCGIHLASDDGSPSLDSSPATEDGRQSHDAGRNSPQNVESAETLVLPRESSPVVEGVREIWNNNDIDIGSGPEDPIHESLVSSDLQDKDALVRECQGSLQIEVEPSEPVGTAQCHSKAQTIENCEPLHGMPTVSRSCNPTPATDVEHQNHDAVRNSSQSPEAGVALMHLDESSSQTERDWDIQSHGLDIGSRVIHDLGAELSAPPPNDMAMPQVAVSTNEAANQSVLQLGIDASNVYGSSTLSLHPNNPSHSPFLIANPLDNELKILCKETQHLNQSCKDMMLHLKSECEKEIREVIAKIRSKYDIRLKAAETDFRLKKSDIHKSLNKVIANKLLADVFTHTPTVLPFSGFPGMQQGNPSGSIQQIHQQSLQQSLQQPASRPVFQQIHQQSLQQSLQQPASRPALPFPNQIAPGDRLTSVHHNPSLSALEPLVEIDHQPRGMPCNRTYPLLPHISSTFGSLDPSYLETLGNYNSAAASSDVVFLI